MYMRVLICSLLYVYMRVFSRGMLVFVCLCEHVKMQEFDHYYINKKLVYIEFGWFVCSVW